MTLTEILRLVMKNRLPKSLAELLWYMLRLCLWIFLIRLPGKLCVVILMYALKLRYIKWDIVADRISFRFDLDRFSSSKMTRFSLVVLTVFAVALVVAQESIREVNNNDGSGTFEFSYDILYSLLFTFSLTLTER